MQFRVSRRTIVNKVEEIIVEADSVEEVHQQLADDVISFKHGETVVFDTPIEAPIVEVEKA